MQTVVIACALFSSLFSAASAEPWFKHPFGELRSYHKDWLNVCEDNGAGACRAVHYQLGEDGDTFFGESRLALLFQADGSYALEVFDQGLVIVSNADAVFDFGSKKIVLAPGQWGTGGPDGINVAETFGVLDSSAQAELVDLIRSKNRLTVSLVVEDGPVAEAEFSLRGSSAAMSAIEELKSR